MDSLTPERRSWNMSRIRDRNTKPEIRVRSLLHAMGYRFRLHPGHLPGKPDIVLPRYRTVIFVHGCFWHRHPGCRFAYTPKSRAEFWSQKFEANVERFAVVERQLKAQGWSVHVIWECETEQPETLREAVERVTTTLGDT